ncbi:MAG TPA: SUMF1/EgtB/PvdO family nonheme iron enzyme [Anaerolineaceae bacterium]|nr:SUMF1/EgtB/PvdO family nonheme iron enzyme [Anaerolineaceae bacterium]
MQLLCVPAGEFTMGRDNTTLTYQSPAHPVYLGAYWIDETEVTNEMYAACVADNERCPLPYQTPDFLNMVASSPTYAGLPVVNTDWNAATAYCAWAGRELPTEAQWEKAARGTDGRLYPWGNEWEGSRANYCDINCEIDDLKDSRHDDFFAFVAPVGSFPDGASPYGALDMAGNVYEWVSDYWADHYIVEKTPTPNPTGPKSGQYRIVRGGSWNYEKLRCQTTDRFKSGQDFQSGYIGFRCATTAPLGPAGTTNP